MSGMGLLNGRYRLDELIGTGGMSSVYHGYDTLLDRDVAIKTLNQDFAKDENLLRSFRREAKSAARLVHPCIVNVYDVGVFHEVNFIVMEYVGGGTLKQEIERKGKLSPKRAIKVATDIASALSLAHARGLVHCDIKPHNILLDENGNAKVADFGIASLMYTAALNSNDKIMGSAHYMPPEQACGDEVSAQSDIYSLGVVLFEMLTGKLPFEAEQDMDVLVQHINEDPPLLRKLLEDAEPTLESIVSKALAKERIDRYQNAYDIMADLKCADALVQESAEDVNETERRTMRGLGESTMPIGGKLAAQEALNKKMQRWTYIIVVSTLLIIGFTIGLFAVYGNFWAGVDVTVPNLNGKKQAEAISILKNARLRASVEENFEAKGPLGTVGRQIPEAGAVVREGRTVKIFINSSRDSVVVPDLMDLTLQQAHVRLSNLGLNIGKVKETFSQNTKDNLIIDQNPLPREKVNKGAAVDVTVIRREDGKIVVPSILGYQLNKGAEVLNINKLQLGSISESESDTPEGLIIYQHPRPNAEVTENTKIEVVIAKPKAAAKAQPANTVDLVFTVPNGKDPQHIRILINKNGVSNIIYDAKHNSGDNIKVHVRTGSRVEFFVDGALTGVRNI